MDVDALRHDTPGTDDVLHFNNAGSALPPAPVVDAQIGHLRREARIGGYEAADAAADQLAHTYDALAALLGCEADEIAVVENATRAWDMAFYGMDFSAGDRILTTRASYASNFIAMLQVAERTGADVEVVPTDADGAVDLEALADALEDDRVALVALTHVPTNGGLVNPAREVGALAEAAGVPFLLDACQSAGQMPLPVGEIGCTMLSATGRKYLRGPRGTGFLYVRRDWIERLDPPFLDLHAATWTGPREYTVRPEAKRFETWESHVAGRVALGVAVDYAMEVGLDAIFDRVQHLGRRLRTALQDVPGVTVYDTGAVQGGITTFAADTLGAEAIQERLRARSMHTSVSPPSSTRLDAEARALPDLVRASVHYYNTEVEIDRFADAVDAIVREEA
jgi:selenocysteine lyase/cysteine desulfurase